MHNSDVDMSAFLDLQHVLTTRDGCNCCAAFTCQLVQATLLQSTIGHLLLLLNHFHKRIVPSLTSLGQLLLVLKLVAPLLGKVSADAERLRHFVTDVFQVITRLAAAGNNDENAVALLSEVLFYILDTYPVDVGKEVIGNFVAALPESIQKRLRFLAQSNCARSF